MPRHDARAEPWAGQSTTYAVSPLLAAGVVPFRQVSVRSFAVEAPVNIVWDHLIKIERWPSWAPHIKRVQLSPPGALTERSRGILHQRWGMTTTFAVTELRYLRHWTWRGRVMGIEVEHTHRFEATSEHRTQLIFTVGCRGSGAALTVKLFTALHGHHLDRAIPLLIAEINGLMGARSRSQMSPG